MVSVDIPNCVEGVSAKNVMSNPEKDWGKDAAFMQYAYWYETIFIRSVLQEFSRTTAFSGSMHDEHVWHDACANTSEPKVMGYAIRTKRWRYIGSRNVPYIYIRHRL